MSFHQQGRGGNRRGGNFHKGGGGGAGGNRHGGSKRAKDFDVPVDENNPVVQCFREYARELDAKHDRYERIVKCSRDITIESKRIIFLLHTVDSKKNNQSKVCNEAKTRLNNLCQTHFATIAKELQGQDPYQYLRAYTSGLQEFIEAYTFCEYVDSSNISHWKTIQDQLKYKVKLIEAHKSTVSSEETPADATSESRSNESEEVDVVCPLPPMEFVLGVGDLTGEVMRKCINSLGSGDIDSCFDHRRFLQEMYKGFISVSNAKNRDFSQKLFTLRQSLLKSENVCYNVKVRGGEAAKWGNTDEGAYAALGKEHLDDDEGVFF